MAFLHLLEMLVFETNEKTPMSKHQLLRRCEDDGYYISPDSFDDYIADMKAAGLEIKRRAELGVERSANRYWYDGGWI